MKAKVLIVEDEDDMLFILKRALEVEGYEVITTKSGEEAINMVREELPELVLLDIGIPGIGGFGVCEKLRSDSLTSLIPIIIITAREGIEDKIKGFKVGADDYITKPVIFLELKTRIEGLLIRSQYRLDVNPLTHLPGNILLEAEIKKRIKKGEEFSVSYIDNDNFKSYNDKYGYERGDRVIKLTSKIIKDVMTNYGEGEGFIGHIGGDDFFLLTSSHRVDAVCNEIIRKFEELIPKEYDEEDREKGYIELYDRSRRKRKIPLMTLSIATVVNEKRRFSHVAEISERLAELKKYAKMKSGSCHVKDRRGI
jgi:diguanylate cyclase (GGDEF)-like protein